MRTISNPFEELRSELNEVKQLLRALIRQNNATEAIPTIDKSQMATRQIAAKYIGVSVGTIDNLVRSKQLKATRVGSAVRFRWRDLDDFINKRSN